MKKAADILKTAQSCERAIAKFLSDIISIPSFSGDEARVVERIGSEMADCGFDEVRTDGLGSIIGRIGKGKKIIAFDAHIDVVDVGNRDLWSFDPFKAHVRDGKVWGRGAADQKAGMASMIYAGKIIKELGLENDYTLLFTGTVMEEDCDGLCWQHLITEENIKPALCVITEPTGLNIYRGQRGRMEMEVVVTGRSAHGSAPERGDNAAYKIARIALEIERLNARLFGDDFLGKGTIVVSKLSSHGPSLCAVPDAARIYIDRRLAANETKDLAIAQVEAMAELEKIDSFEVRVPIYQKAAYTGKIYPMEKYYPSWTIPEDHEAILAAKRTFGDLFGKAPEIGKWTFSTNGVTICGVHGIPCVGFGPGYEEQAHAPNEWVPTEHLWKAAAFYAWFPQQISTMP
ncbi:MAG: YgeY family selenium metabolism-linked hydrolase [Pseudomonadota bacterium]